MADAKTTKEKIIGIDLGTSNSQAAVIIGGKPVIIPSAEGATYAGKMFPSFVAFTKDGQVLVGENVFQFPTNILRLYEKRGDIVHGGSLNITLYEEYVHLLDCCLRVLTKLIYLTQKFQDVETLKELLSKIENRETLEDFIENCKRGVFKGRKIADIRKVAVNLLKQYT